MHINELRAALFPGLRALGGWPGLAGRGGSLVIYGARRYALRDVIKPFYKMDAWIVARFERAGRGWQRLTGLDCFWLAKQCAVIGFILLMVAAGRGIYKLDGDMSAAFPAVTNWYFVRVCDRIASRARSESMRGLANSEKLIMGWFRMFYLIFSMMIMTVGRHDFYMTMLKVNAVLTWAAMNWLACDPLPPCKSKIRQWLSGLKKQKAQVAEPEPARG